MFFCSFSVLSQEDTQPEIPGNKWSKTTLHFICGSPLRQNPIPLNAALRKVPGLVLSLHIGHKRVPRAWKTPPSGCQNLALSAEDDSGAGSHCWEWHLVMPGQMEPKENKQTASVLLVIQGVLLPLQNPLFLLGINSKSEFGSCCRYSRGGKKKIFGTISTAQVHSHMNHSRTKRLFCSHHS